MNEFDLKYKHIPVEDLPQGASIYLYQRSILTLVKPKSIHHRLAETRLTFEPPLTMGYDERSFTEICLPKGVMVRIPID